MISPISGTLLFSKFHRCSKLVAVIDIIIILNSKHLISRLSRYSPLFFFLSLPLSFLKKYLFSGKFFVFLGE